jgi:hypothetical protein
MTSYSSTVALDYVKIFGIPKATRIVVRLDDRRGSGYQECQVAHKDTSTVDAWLREFGGAAFTLEIDLNLNKASLTWPNRSRGVQPAGMAAIVAGKIIGMLEMHRSSPAFQVTRCVSALKRGVTNLLQARQA